MLERARGELARSAMRQGLGVWFPSYLRGIDTDWLALALAPAPVFDQTRARFSGETATGRP